MAISKIKERREKRGLTKKDLADMVGVSERAIDYYEAGKREPRASILKLIAKALKCRMEDLI